MKMNWTPKYKVGEKVYILNTKRPADKGQYMIIHEVSQCGVTHEYRSRYGKKWYPEEVLLPLETGHEIQRKAAHPSPRDTEPAIPPRSKETI